MAIVFPSEKLRTSGVVQSEPILQLRTSGVVQSEPILQLRTSGGVHTEEIQKLLGALKDCATLACTF